MCPSIFNIENYQEHYKKLHEKQRNYESKLKTKKVCKIWVFLEKKKLRVVKKNISWNLIWKKPNI